MTILSRASLEGIRSNLMNFEEISGLSCNYDKTVLMPVFPPTDEEINFCSDLDFRIVNKIHLLGMDITPDFVDKGKNFLVVKEKILKQVRFWERFKLTLPQPCPLHQQGRQS
jgi:hypothetical protein